MRHRVKTPVAVRTHQTRAKIARRVGGPTDYLLGGLSSLFNHVNPETVSSQFHHEQKYKLPCFGGRAWKLVKPEILSEIERFNTNITQAIYDHLIMKYETLQDINTSYQAERKKIVELTSNISNLTHTLASKESELKMVNHNLQLLKTSNEQCNESNRKFYDQITACQEEYRVCNVNFTNATAELKSVQQSIQENSTLLRECRSSLAQELKQHTDKLDKRPEKERRLQNVLSTMETENLELSKRLKDASKLIKESKLGNDKKQHQIQILRKNERALRGRKEPEKKQFVQVEQKERELWINEKARLEAEKKSVEDKLAEKSAARREVAREKQALEEARREEMKSWGEQQAAKSAARRAEKESWEEDKKQKSLERRGLKQRWAENKIGNIIIQKMQSKKLEKEKKSLEEKMTEKSVARRAAESEKQSLEARYEALATKNSRRAQKIKDAAAKLAQISRRQNRGLFERLKRKVLRRESNDLPNITLSPEE